MSENMEAIGTESTTSTVEAENVGESAAAQETMETTVDTQGSESGEGTTPPPEDNGASAQEAEGTASGDAGFVLPVRFNHEDRDLTLDEARSWAQRGMRADAAFSKLELIAAANGQTVEQAVASIFDAFEQTHRNEILQKVGGNEEAADALMEKKRAEWNLATETARNTEKQAEADSRKALEERLATGFAEVGEMFPGEYPEFKNIPQAVVNDAIKNNRGLLDALLRYRHKEGVKVEQNKQAQERAAAASAGSQADKPSGDPGLDSIDRAFFSALG